MSLLAAAATRRRVLVAMPDLVLPSTGEFRVTGSGIATKLNSPLSKLSGHYPWQFFPVGVAMLKLIVADDDMLSASLIGKLLTDKEQGQIAEKIGRINWTRDCDRDVLEHDSDFCGEVDRLVRWSADLAIRCPYASVARDLERIPHMPACELDRYVRPRLAPLLRA